MLMNKSIVLVVNIKYSKGIYTIFKDCLYVGLMFGGEFY